MKRTRLGFLVMTVMAVAMLGACGGSGDGDASDVADTDTDANSGDVKSCSGNTDTAAICTLLGSSLGSTFHSDQAMDLPSDFPANSDGMVYCGVNDVGTGKQGVYAISGSAYESALEHYKSGLESAGYTLGAETDTPASCQWLLNFNKGDSYGNIGFFGGLPALYITIIE